MVDISEIKRQAEKSGMFSSVAWNTIEFIRMEMDIIRGNMVIWIKEDGTVEAEQDFNCCRDSFADDFKFENFKQFVEEVEGVKAICGCEEAERAEIM